MLQVREHQQEGCRCPRRILGNTAETSLCQSRTYPVLLIGWIASCQGVLVLVPRNRFSFREITPFCPFISMRADFLKIIIFDIYKEICTINYEMQCIPMTHHSIYALKILLGFCPLARPLPRGSHCL